jgi:iron complex outermembrane recepter protein
MKLRVRGRSRMIDVLLFAALAVAGPIPAFATETHQFDVPAEDAPTAIRDFANQAHVQILVAGENVGKKQLRPVSGEFSTEEGLGLLLADSGLSPQYVGDRSIALVKASDMISPADGNAKEGKRSSSSGLRLAEVDQAKSSGASSVAENSNNTSAGLEEIIVTAQKRTERLIDTPQSIAVLSAEQLDALGARNFSDYADTIPGLTLTSQGVGGNQISLRGVTLGQDTSPTVGMYVDDVPFGSSTGFAQGAQTSIDVGLFDIDRIEVLKGPQGTLYGASTMGGLIKYVSKQPDPTAFYGTTQTGVAFTEGGGVSYNLAAAVNAPIITDTVALRASIFESHEGGFIDNVALDEKNANHSDVYGGRLDLLVKPTDQLTIRVGGFVQNVWRAGISTVDYTLTGQAPYGSLGQNRLIPEPFEQLFRLGSFHVTYDFGFSTLTSVSSYQSNKIYQDQDYSAELVPEFSEFGLGNFSSVGAPEWVRTDKFTQEVRLASNGTHTVDWLIGGFYTHERSQNQQAVQLRDPAGNPAPNNLFIFSGPTTYEEYAAFGDVTYHITKAFDVSGGIRDAHNNQTIVQYGAGALESSGPQEELSASVRTYSADARYHFTDSVMGYVRYSTGYRPGGPNLVAIAPATGLPAGPASFQADTLKSYEAGIKAESPDRKYEIEATGYFINWNNIQVVTNDGGFTAYTNAPSGASIPGAEFSLTARPIESLIGRASFSYNDAHLKDAVPSIGGLAGEQLPNVAKISGTAGLDYTIWSGGPKPTVGTTVRYVSGRTASFEDSESLPQYHVPAYATMDLRSGLTFNVVAVQLYLHNLFNKRGQMSATTTLGYPEVALVEPLTIGINLTTHF